MVRMRMFAMTSKHSMSRRWVAALTALCFAVLVSIAASHLHLGLDADEACAVCAAVAGVAGPSATPVAALNLQIGTWLPIVARPLPSPRIRAVVLPPSCGPPRCP
jgi:hypothetical protein